MSVQGRYRTNNNDITTCSDTDKVSVTLASRVIRPFIKRLISNAKSGEENQAQAPLIKTAPRNTRLKYLVMVLNGLRLESRARLMIRPIAPGLPRRYPTNAKPEALP